MNTPSDDERLKELLSRLPEDERNQIGRTWQIAASASDEALSSDELASAFQKVKRRISRDTTGLHVKVRQTIAIAATLVIGFTSGYLLSLSRSNSGNLAGDAASQAQYLILIWNDAAQADPSEQATLVREFRDWAVHLAEQHRLVDAAELQNDGRIMYPTEDGDGVRTSNLTMMDERATGYFLIRAGSRQEAEEIARSSPQIRHGGTVELRQIIR